MSTNGRQYAGRSSQARRDDRRQRFLAAGLGLIGQDGIAALSVRGLCARAELTPRYFYEEFGSTDVFARQLFDREFDEGIARVGSAVATAGPDILERVDAAIGAVLDVVTEVPDRAALLLAEAQGAGVLSERRRERMEDVVAIVAAYGRNTYGAVDPLSPADDLEVDRAVRSAAAFVAGGLAQTVDDWLGGRIERSRPVLQRELATHIVAVGNAAFALVRQTLDQNRPPGTASAASAI